MEEEYIENTVTIRKFFKDQQVQHTVRELFLRSVPNLEHPSVILSSLYEVSKHAKKSACVCIDAPNKSGRTYSALGFLLDTFLKHEESLEEIDGEVPP